MLSPHLQADLKRVAVLPLVGDGTTMASAQGCDELAPILVAELGKTGRFEIVSVNPEDLRSLTGRTGWTGGEILPADFLDSLQRVYGCDAVLFSELSVYRANVPLAIGWRMKLVDVRTGLILWAADREFDASERTVSADAHHYEGGDRWIWPWAGAKDDWLMDHSPRRFGQYAIARTVATLPKRQETVKVLPVATDVPNRRQNDKNTADQK